MFVLLSFPSSSAAGAPVAPCDLVARPSTKRGCSLFRSTVLLLASFLSTAALAQGSVGRVVPPADGAKVLGALSNDLVYTPVAPCRILNTSATAAGPIASGGMRSFVAINSSNFLGQGGSATNCGTLGLSATAVVVNVTAVAPSLAGAATLYSFDTPSPATASIQYAAGAVVSNEMVVQIRNPLASFDFTVATTAASNFQIDIVGYFAPPVATALQCVETANTTTLGLGVVPNGTRNELAPNCPAGYTQTTTNCTTSSWLMPIVFSKDGTCSARNNDSINQFLSASRTCCRVPGR